MSGKADQGPVVPRRERVAYQLPRATWSYPSSEMIHKRAQHPGYLAQNGQVSYINRLGGTVSFTAEPTTTKSMVVVHEQRHHTESHPSSREAQCNSGQGIASDEGQNTLDVLSESLSEHQKAARRTLSGPVCLQTIQPATTLCGDQTWGQWLAMHSTSFYRIGGSYSCRHTGPTSQTSTHSWLQGLSQGKI